MAGKVFPAKGRLGFIQKTQKAGPFFAQPDRILQPGNQQILILYHSALKIETVVFQLIQHIVTRQVHVIGRNDEGVGGDTLDLSVVRLSNAA